MEKATLEVNFLIPEETKLLSGAKEWTGSVKKENRQNLVLQVKVPVGERALIEASVTADYEGRQSHSSLGLWLGDKLGKESPPKTDSKGRPIKEYKGTKKED